jgi:hypothetical protein
MNRKIEIVKKKRESKASEQALANKQLEVQERLTKAIKGLSVLLESQEQYDYDKLHTKLTEIDERLDLAPLFESLEKSVKDSRYIPADKTKIEGFSELLETVKNIKQETIVKVGNIADEYRPSDASYESGENFFGFLHPTGKWYVMRQSGGGGGIFRYANGGSKYTSSWTSRASLDYKHYNEITL